MPLLTVRAAAGQLGVAVLDLEALGPHGPRADDADGGRPPSHLRRRDRSPAGAPAAGRGAAPPHAGRRREPVRPQRAQPAAGIRGGGPRRRAARAGPLAGRRSIPDRGDHGGRRAVAETPPRRRRAGDRQIDGGHDRARAADGTHQEEDGCSVRLQPDPNQTAVVSGFSRTKANQSAVGSRRSSVTVGSHSRQSSVGSTVTGRVDSHWSGRQSEVGVDCRLPTMTIESD